MQAGQRKQEEKTKAAVRKLGNPAFRTEKQEEYARSVIYLLRSHGRTRKTGKLREKGAVKKA